MSDLQHTEIVPPNPEMLTIVRLHLERLPIMTDEERKVFLMVTKFLATPAFIVPGDFTWKP